MTQSRKETSKPTVLQSVVTGSVAGATEVFVDHPLWSIKTRLQRGAPFTLQPSILYRGMLPNAASMVPITGLQVGLNRFFQKAFFNDKQELSKTQSLSSAFAAGVGSSFVSCPTEMVMTYQGKSGGSFVSSLRQLYAQGGYKTLFTGLPVTAMREGPFTAFYLGVTPLLKAKIKPYCSNDYAASLAAGMVAGVGATLATQGFDTLKTVQQDADPQKPVGPWQAAKKIYSANGVYGFFKGSVPRGTRVMSAVTIMGIVNEKMEKAFNKGETTAPKLK